MDSNGPDETRYDYVWNLRPTHAPMVSRHCAKCEKTRPFYCSEKFRINAQQKNVDVWLIYKCKVCDTTWNCSIMRQVNPRTIPPDLFDKLQNNDQKTSWDYAFRFDLIKRNEAVPDTNIEYTVEGEKIDYEAAGKGKVTVLLTAEYRLDPRLDTLLSGQLGVSRKQLNALFEGGGMEIDPPGVGNLKKRLKEKRIVLTIDTGAVRKLLSARQGGADGARREGEDASGG